jgi:Tfp pilus assembly protein PilX
VIARALRSERGSALVAATFVMTAILTLGLAMLATVDTQTRQTGRERGRESTFNWVEAVLNAQTFTVANAWPASADKAVSDCSWSGGAAASASGGMVNACPTPTLVSNTFSSNVDVARGANWTTQVRDNAGSAQCEDTTASNCSFAWSEQTSLAAAHWDENADDLLWLRAEATVNNDKRIVVALVRIQNDPVQLPQSVIVAGSLEVSGGNKTFISQNGSSISLRCSPISSPSCYSEQKPGINVAGPGSKIDGYDDGNGGHIMTEDELDAMRTKAQNIGRYYGPGVCPSTAAAFSGAVVFLEDAPDCKINHNWVINSEASPGILIVYRGTVRFNGTADFWGLIYMYNAQGWGAGDDNLFDGNGDGTIHGALFVDGEGRVNNQGAFNLDYNANALNGVTAYGATGIVPNSFREVNP